MSARADDAAGLLLPPRMTKGASSGALQTSPNDTLAVTGRASSLPGRRTLWSVNDTVQLYAAPKAVLKSLDGVNARRTTTCIPTQPGCQTRPMT
jgi:hypothetical protein